MLYAQNEIKRARIKYLLSLFLFASNGIVASYISLNSYEIVFLRSVMGSVILLALFAFSRQKLTAFGYKKDTFFIILSGISMAFEWMTLFEAYDRIGVGISVMINYSGPVIVMALAPLIFKEKLTFQKICAMAIAVVGVILISSDAAFGGMDIAGILFAVLSAVLYSSMVICDKKSVNVTGVENTVIQMVSACITLTLFVGIKQGFAIDIAAGDWLPLLWLGIVNTGAACYCYFSSIGKLPVHTVAICGYLEPMLAVLMSAVILGESMSLIQYAGAALIILGALLGEGVFGMLRNKVPAKHDDTMER